MNPVRVVGSLWTRSGRCGSPNRLLLDLDGAPSPPAQKITGGPTVWPAHSLRAVARTLLVPGYRRGRGRNRAECNDRPWLKRLAVWLLPRQFPLTSYSPAMYLRWTFHVPRGTIPVPLQNLDSCPELGRGAVGHAVRACPEAPPVAPSVPEPDPAGLPLAGRDRPSAAAGDLRVLGAPGALVRGVASVAPRRPARARPGRRHGSAGCRRTLSVYRIWRQLAIGGS